MKVIEEISKRKVKAVFFVLIICLTHLMSCMTAGTHGSLKVYKFNVSKVALQTAIEDFIHNNKFIKFDSSTTYTINKTFQKSDTIFSNRYNDNIHYSTIIFLSERDLTELNEYTFQYLGDEGDWNTSKTSSLSLVYAYDRNGNGGSIQSGLSNKTILRENLVHFFEQNLINPLDNQLKK